MSSKLVLPASLNKHQLGVISDKGLATYNKQAGKSVAIKHANNFKHIGEVASFVRSNGVENVWIAPNTELSSKILNHDFVLDAKQDGFVVEENTEYTNYFSVYIPQTKGITYFTVIEHENSSWDYLEDLKPSELYEILTLLSKYLPVDIKCSPSFIGKRIIEKTCYTVERHEKPNWLAPCDFEYNPNMICHDIIFTSKNFTGKKYVHKYDKNSAFGASCVGQMFGEGTPIYKKNIPFDSKTIGLWRIKNIQVQNTEYDNTLLPIPYDSQWIYTPVGKTMEKLGFSFEVEDAYIWEKSHKTLADFASIMWDCRTKLEVETVKSERIREMAIYWTKFIIKATSGGFNFTFNGKKSALYRPDFTNIIKAANKERMYLTIEKNKLAGYYPLLVYIDAIYYLSDNPNPYEAIPGMLDREHAYGGFKYDGTVLWDDLKPFYAQYQDEPSMILHHFNLLKTTDYTQFV